MNDNLPDAVNRDGGESDVVAERSGADTPKARRPIPADWPDTDTNPAIPTPEIIDPGTDSAAEADAEAEGDKARDGDGEEEVRPDAGPTG